MPAAVLGFGNDDDEELRVRALRGVKGPDGPQPLISIAPPELSPFSSIGPSEKEASPPLHRPSLSDPSALYNLMGVYAKSEQLMGKEVRLFHAEVTKSKDLIDRLSAEKEEALQKEAEAANNRATWSALATVAQYITGAASLVIGFTIGGFFGSCMALSGMVGVTKQVVDDTSLLKAGVEWYTKSDELQNRITNNIAMGTFLLQMGLGSMGWLGAWHGGTLANVSISGKATEVLNGASSAMSGSSQVGTSAYNKAIAELQKEIREKDSSTVLAQQAMHSHTQRMTKGLEAAQTLAENMQKIIHASAVSQE